MTSEAIQPWAVACVQANWENYNANVKGEFEGDTLKKRNLDMMCAYIDACFNVGRQPRPVRLVCFPEFSIGGLYGAITTTKEVKQWQAITIPGPETDVLASKASEHNCYIAACNHENDPSRPDFFFNTAFIINPRGKIILKYRKLNTQFGCNPHDIFDEYRDPITGEHDFFPVVETEIGRLSCGICIDMAIPEIPKIYALKGADVWLHLTSGRTWVSWDPATADALIRIRAIDNTIYLVHENWAARVLTTETLGGTKIATHLAATGGGNSMIVDPYGVIISQANGTAEQLVIGEIDVMTLREKRKRWRGRGTGNAVAQTRTELYAPYYRRTIFPPNQVLAEGPLKHADDEIITRRRMQAVANVIKGYSFYSENDVK